jgi:RNA polymerase sigma factor (sigma-70 family)
MSNAATNPEIAASTDGDAELLRRYSRRRDAAAFAELVHRYGGFVFSVARRVTGDSHDAEDVTQQCFLELARRARMISGSLAGWMHRAAYTRSLNARRDRATRQVHEAAAIPATGANEEPAWAELEPLIDDAIAALSDELRVPLLRHYLQQKSQAEVAAELGVNQSTVSRRLSQGVEALRERLKEGGVTMSVAGLATGLTAMSAHPLLPELASSLAKVGLAGVGPGAAGLAGGTAAKVAIMAGLLIVAAAAVVIIMQMQAGSSPPNVSPAAPAAQAISTAPQGFVCDPLGRPVSNAYISSSLKQIWTGERSDVDGKFNLNDPRVGRGISFAYSQRSAKLAIFSVPESAPASPLPVVLQWNVATADGIVVNAAGSPIAGVAVHVFVTLPNGRSFLAFTSLPTDNSGYYQVQEMLPSGPGLKLHASLSIDANAADSTPAAETNGALVIEFADLVDRSGRPVAANPGPKQVRYSGRVVDEDGAPIAGAIVSMSYPFQHMIAGAGDLLTDKDGRFSRLVPPAANRVDVRLLHPDFIGFHFTSRDPQPDVQSLLNGSAVFVMHHGLSVSGVVRNGSGKPVPNALVLAGRLYSTTAGPENEPIEDCTSARTDWDGRFQIGGLPAGDNSLEILADGFAPHIQGMNLNEKTGPVNISVGPGVTWSAQVVDVNGSPVVGARVGCREWHVGTHRGLLSRFTKTDIEGRFTLRQLPAEGELSMSASTKSLLGMDFQWTPGGNNPQQITLYAPPVVSGAVRDAETDKPITKFDVVPGLYWQNGNGRFDESDFDGVSHVNSSAGLFTKKIQQVVISQNMPGFAVQIVAQGYEPGYSPKVYPGKRYEPFVIRLKKARTTTAPQDP